MKHDLETFLSRVPEFGKMPLSQQIDYFVYFLIEHQAASEVSPAQVKACFNDAQLTPHSNIPHYLGSNLKRKAGTPPKFIRKNSKYSLHRDFSTTLAASLKDSHLVVAAKSTLRDLLPKVANANKQTFLTEAITCFEVKAYRAATIMVWNLALDHLTDYILQHALAAFNAVLSTNTDKRVKITKIATKDDFADIPEGKFIEFCRSAKIITNDLRKILDVKLGIRNTCAHPSSVVVSESKVVDVIEDLVNNVVLKFRI